MSEIIEKLERYIRDEIGYEGELEHHIDLLDQEILDSFSVVEMATFIQTSFDVELSGEDLVRENFATVSAMAALITARSANSGSPD